jgi:L-asparaginase
MSNEILPLFILTTGGTIEKIYDEFEGSLQNKDTIVKNKILQKLRLPYTDIHLEPIMAKDSLLMDDKDRASILQSIRTYSQHGNPIVVLHGTDTMSYSASMLSFMLENLNKPVIFTGSQLPMGVVRTDGRDNFINAIEIAAARIDGTPLVPEVAIYFENKLMRGNRTNKFNAENFNAFLSGNYPPLAEVGVHIRYNTDLILKPNFRKLKVYKNLDNSVLILKLFPGIAEIVVKSALNIVGLKGIILETYGAGNAPTDAWFIEALTEAINKGIVIYNVTQCKGGAVDMGKYETSMKLSQIGVIGGYDITTESAIAKMMYLFGQGYGGAELKRLLMIPLRGELTV